MRDVPTPGREPRQTLLGPCKIRRVSCIIQARSGRETGRSHGGVAG